jgi:hypothetical protein
VGPGAHRILRGPGRWFPAADRAQSVSRVTGTVETLQLLVLQSRSARSNDPLYRDLHLVP